jgi:large subunit ribosomal protein L6
MPQAVKAELDGRHLKVSGPLGSLEFDCHPGIDVKVEQDDSGGTRKILVENGRPDDRTARQLHGTMRTLIANMVTGVSKGFEKKMELYGTGYSVNDKSGKLVFQMGFCHPVQRAIPEGIKVKIENPAAKGNDVPARFVVTGTDKHLLGQFAAELRKLQPPEPYKGKGIRYAGEYVRRKAGKAFTSGAA